MMMNRLLVFGVILIIVVAAVAIIQQQVDNQQRLKTVALVDKAVQEIQQKGEAAFPEFNSPQWYQGDTYVFVWRIDGVRVVYPPDPTAVGQNLTDLKDSTGKPIGKLFIQTAENGGGWVEYLYPKPGTNVPSKKETYIQKVQYQNTTYLVGSGYYID